MINSWKPVAWTLAAVAMLGTLSGVVLVFGGVYDVSATSAHLQPVYTLLETAMQRSVQRRAAGIVEPPAYDSDERIRRGAVCYRDRCEQCHGAPGLPNQAIGMAMQPVPGSLIGATRQWRARELYWITRHGIKMSGMPAWQYHLSESDLWSVVALLRQLPDVTPAAYGELMTQVHDQRCDAPAQAAAVATAAATARSAALSAVAPQDRIKSGNLALRMYGCHACHQIPGVTGSQHQVGPPLAGFASRKLIAGRLANTQQNLVNWIRQPQRIDPNSAMPDLGVTLEHAQEMAAYLLTLR